MDLEAFFRRSKCLFEDEWFEGLEQFINKTKDFFVDVEQLDREFEKQPYVIYFWLSVLSELKFLERKLERDLVFTQANILQKVMNHTKLTYRLIDLVCSQDERIQGIEKRSRRLRRVIEKVEAIITALDHKRTALNYFAKRDLPSRSSF